MVRHAIARLAGLISLSTMRASAHRVCARRIEEEIAWDRTIAINLKGVFLSMKYEIAEMLKSGEA